MLITYLLEEYPDILTNPPNISDLTVIYKASKARFDADADFKEKSRLNVVNLQAGDEVCRKVWNTLCKYSTEYCSFLPRRVSLHLPLRCGLLNLR